MITTKNNFKGYLHRKYPDIISYPIYGLPIYILDKSLDEVDAWDYHQQQLPNGKFIVFIGINVAEATKLLTQLNKTGIPTHGHTREKETAPTTFSCFEAWLERHQEKWINRTFCNNMSPRDCLHSDDILCCSAPLRKGTWYMYELPAYLDTGKAFDNIPHIVIDDGTNRGDILIALIKASASKYKSKKQRFIEKFQFMQPIYEQLIAACAVATGQDDWDKAHALCIQYMSTQFEREGTVDIDKMKEAYCNGTIGLFVRDPENLYPGDTETF